MTHPGRGYCPQLGLRSDRKTVFGFPSEEHRCFVGQTRRPIDLPHQQAFCLSADYPSCPWWAQDPTPPVSAVAAGSELAEMPAVEPAAGDDGSTVGRAEIPALRILTDRLKEWNQEISLLEIGAWVAFGIFAVLFLYFFLVRPLGAPPPRPTPVLIIQPTPSPSATPALTPTPSVLPTPSSQVTPRPVTQPTVAPGQRAYTLTPLANAVGWVASGDRFNHFGDRNLHVGVYRGQTYYGAMQFDLSTIPTGSTIEYAAVKLMGLSGENLGAGGTWQLQMLAPNAVEKWPQATYTAIQEAAVAESIGPTLTPGDLAARQVNVFEFSPAQRRELEHRLQDGVVAFRLDGPTQGEDSLFTWDTGYGDGGLGNRPILYLVVVPPPTPTLIVATLTPTPANVVTLAAILATATYEARMTGTPATPPAVVTPTPPFVITNTPTPANAATAAWLDLVATAQAFVYGTPTPLPTYAITATPVPTKPLLEYLDQMTPPPSATPTLTPTATPTGIPQILQGKIAFLTDRFGGKEPTVLVMNPDGTGLARLNVTWAYYRALELDTFSPDRSQRLVVRGSQGAYEIWVQNTADGWTWYLTGAGRVAYDPSWSPDSTHIAFVAQAGGNDEIFVLNKDTQQEIRLTNNQWEWDKHPSWSPDGRQIVFWSNRETGRKQIWIMNADGSEQRQLLASDFNDWDPVWIK
jgi:hypothetical protein